LVNASPQRKPSTAKRRPYPIYDNFCKATKAGYQADLVVRILDSDGHHLTLEDAYKEFQVDSDNFPNSRELAVIELIDSIQQTKISAISDFEITMKSIKGRVKELQKQAEDDLLHYLGLK